MKGLSSGQDALRLAQRVAIQNGGLAARGAQISPLHDVAGDVRRAGPAIDRQPERGFGDEGVAGHDFKWAAGRIRLALVVPRHDPGLAVRLDAYLCGTQDMPGRMQRYAGIAQRERLAVGVHAIVLLAQSPLQDRQAFGTGVIAAHSHPGVIAMSMGQHSGGHRPPRIDVELAGRTVQAFRTQLHNVAHDSPRAQILLSSQRTGNAANAAAASIRFTIL